MINSNKDRVQQEALVAWRDSGYRGTVCLATGFGKTKVGVIAAGELLRKTPEAKVLIVVPRTNLQKNEWPNEFEKWGYRNELHTLHIHCINSIYTWTDQEWDLIVLDEVHKYFSPEFSKVFNFKTKKLLGLTATPPKHNKEYLTKMGLIVPVVFEKTLDESVELQAISDYQVFNVPVTFNKKEAASYRKWDNKFKIAFGKLSWLKKKDDLKESLFDLATFLSKDEYKHRDEHFWAKDFWLSMQKRKALCYAAQNKKSKALEIIRQEQKVKWILFTKGVNFCEELTDYLNKHNIKAIAYHSKLKNRDEVLEKYSSEDYVALVTVDALNEGFNLPSITNGISIAGVSTELTNWQQMGRTTRLSAKNKVAKFYNLYVKNSQEEKWVLNKTKNLKNVTWNLPA